MNRHGFEIRIRQAPQGIALVAEIFQPQPHGLGIGHQIRTPVIENLQAPDVNAPFLNVNPVVLQHSRFQLFTKQAHRNKIPVRQRRSDAFHLFIGFKGKCLKQIFHRHGAEDQVCFVFHGFTGCIFGPNGANSLWRPIQFHDGMFHKNATAHFLYFFGHTLPHLSRPQLGIQEFFYERCFRVFLPNIHRLFAAQYLLKCMSHGLAHRQPFHALCAPVLGYFMALETPDFLSIILEKREVQFLAKTVDDKVFQGYFGFARKQAYGSITEDNFKHPHHSEVSQGLQVQRNRITEEFT